MTPHFYDFYSGAGGTSRGMQDAGMIVRFGLDIDQDAKTTFQANHKNADFICRDIRSVSADDIAPYIKRQEGCPLVFGVCAPCQPFSKQNRTKNSKSNNRYLLGEIHRFVEAYTPEYIFVENVPGLQTVGNLHGPLAEFIRLLEKLYYFFDYEIVAVCRYGVPQSRRRLVLLASLLAPIKIPPPTHGPGTANPESPTVWKSISHLPPIEAGETHAEVPNHQAARLSPKNLRRIALTPVGGNRKNWPPELELRCHQKHLGHTDVYGRMIKDRPSPALTTRCISLSNGRYGHPTQNRAISVREAACIQTFPMDFIFRGTLTSTARQVGNAVPVAMAKVFGEAIIRHYQCHKEAKAA